MSRKSSEQQSLTDLQCKILSALEEAGEDDVAALLNLVSDRQGSPAELNAYIRALKGLFDSRFVEGAYSRDPISLIWVQLPPDQLESVLNELASLLSWGAGDRMWDFGPEKRLRILLTDAGLEIAREILSSPRTH